MELANLELERKQAELRAPMDGVVTSGDIKVGDMLAAGKAVVEIAEEKGFLFEAEVPSTEVAHLRAGMAARIKLDAYRLPAVRYPGRPRDLCLPRFERPPGSGHGRVFRAHRGRGRRGPPRR